jgi:hypothetical protein
LAGFKLTASVADRDMAMADGGELDLGRAGASARREYERRKAGREARVKERHPRIGNMLLKLQDAPAHERAWDTGSKGEELLGASLVKHCPDLLVLHSRRMPRSRADIDHLAVAPSGVYVIDAKRYKGKIVVQKSLFGPEKLMIAGRDKTKLVDGLERQAAAVSSALEKAGALDIPVHACFCFLNPEGLLAASDLPIFRTLNVRGFPLYLPRKLVKRLNQPGPLDPAAIRSIAESLVAAFPAA